MLTTVNTGKAQELQFLNRKWTRMNANIFIKKHIHNYSRQSVFIRGLKYMV